MARTMIDIDEEALAEAARVLGTTTKKDTVNAALREAVARERRLEALLESQEMAARGEIAWDLWEQEQAMEKAIAAKVAARFAARDTA
ncbi:MAG: type II toxin-antitoxin system VapB family antitoxin [Dactylosporangium sp.]|nr:type II toxin-antitoxin system VapB family antitoxin [Dactylosporangium sp.]